MNGKLISMLTGKIYGDKTKKTKKILKSILLSFLVIYIIFVIIFIIEDCKKFKYILIGYKDKYEIKEYVFQSGFVFRKYYYDSSFDKKYKNNKYYQKVEDNIEIVKGYVLISQETWDKGELFDINKVITENDYFYVIDETETSSNGYPEYYIKLYLYDVDEHVLYYIENVL